MSLATSSRLCFPAVLTNFFFCESLSRAPVFRRALKVGGRGKMLIMGQMAHDALFLDGLNLMDYRCGGPGRGEKRIRQRRKVIRVLILRLPFSARQRAACWSVYTTAMWTAAAALIGGSTSWTKSRVCLTAGRSLGRPLCRWLVAERGTHPPFIFSAHTRTHTHTYRTAYGERRRHVGRARPCSGH